MFLRMLSFIVYAGACLALPQETTLYLGAAADVYKSTDGGSTWKATRMLGPDDFVYQHGAMFGNGVTAIAIDPVNPSIVYASTNARFELFTSPVGFYRSTNAGNSWTLMNSSFQPNILVINPSNTSILYGSSLITGGVLKSVDSGATWKATGLANGLITALTLDPTDSSTLYASALESSAVYQSHDGGGTWRPLGNIPALGSPYFISALDIDPSNPATIYAACSILDDYLSSPGQVPKCSVFKSTDGGNMWHDTRVPGFFNSAVLDQVTPSTILAGGISDPLLGGYAVKSTNGAASWTPINAGLTSKRVYLLAIDPSSSSTIYAATQGSDPFFKSSDGGVTWRSSRTGIPDVTSYFPNPAYSLAVPPQRVSGTPKPILQNNALVNAASFLLSPISPGEIVTIFGSSIGPTQLTGLELDGTGLVATVLSETRVLFDGAPAPLIYVRADIVSAIVPYAVAGKQSVQIQVEYRGVKSNAIKLQIADSAPGIFTLNAAGKGQVAMLNEDSMTLNSPEHPAKLGSIVTFFATGEGLTDPQAIDGAIARNVLPKPRLPVFVRIGGQSAEIVYAGTAPQSVAGFVQVNARVPSGVVPGSAVTVELMVGTATSQTGITMAITR